jgi:murein hydrolase activator
MPAISRALVSLLLVLSSAGVLGAQPAERELSRDAEQRIAELQAESDRLARETRTLLGELRALELQREIKAQELKKADADLTLLTETLRQTHARLASIEAERLAHTPVVTERLVDLYKRGRGGYARLLFGAEDLREFGRLTRAVATMARLDRFRFDAQRRLLHTERQIVATLEAQRASLALAQEAAVSARAALDGAVVAQNRRIDELDRRRDLAAAYVGELQAAQEALQQRLRGVDGASPVDLPLPPFRGTLQWPASGRLLSRHGPTTGPSGTTVVRNGIEIAVSEGEPIRAVHGGTVLHAAPFAGFGMLVIVDHGRDAFTLYGHLAKAAVAEGARVQAGMVVGHAGRNPAGVQALYFELRIDGQAVNPVQWLRSTR